MATLDEIRRIAEVEFASVVTDAEVMGVKLRIILKIPCFQEGEYDRKET